MEQTVLTAPSATPVKAGLARGLIKQARPKQWAKNGLVVVAPAAAGVLTHGAVLGRVLLAFVAFCLAASGTYYINDALDVEADRAHPTKRFRPMAAGTVPVGLGWVVAVVLLVAGLAVAGTVSLKLGAVIAVYLVITTTYSSYLKHQPVLEMAAVAAGFVVRAVAGGVAAPVRISEWFLIVASFAAVFVVAGKRHGEFVALGAESAATRPSMQTYTLPFLRFVWMLAAAVTVTGYCLWAFEQSAGSAHPIAYQLSVLPFVLGLLEYALVIERGAAGAPEDVILHDPKLLALGATWAVAFACGVYWR